jgi:photosystem II stability/assembly factor-like uncharacterized protein
MYRRLILLILALLLAACTPISQTTAPAPAGVAGTPVISLTDTPVSIPSITPAPLALPTVPSPALIHIDFINTNNGWGIATNDNGYILHTIDGGRTWLNATPAGISPIGFSTSFFALDANTAWVLPAGTDFYASVLYHTNDGGATWASNPVPFSSALIQFLDAATGRALADRGGTAGSNAVELYQTSDGGLTWRSVFYNNPDQAGSSDSLPFGGVKSGMTFIDANTGWVTGSGPMTRGVYLFMTRDGGASWTRQSLPLPVGYDETYQYITSAPIFFGSYGYLPLLVFPPDGNTNMTFYTSSDGGASWNGDPGNASRAITPGHYSFSDAAHGHLWPGGANLYFTNDGAQTWESMTVSLDLYDFLSQLDFVDANTGWALSGPAENGHTRLFITTNSGATWVPLIP